MSSYAITATELAQQNLRDAAFNVLGQMPIDGENEEHGLFVTKMVDEEAWERKHGYSFQEASRALLASDGVELSPDDLLLAATYGAHPGTMMNVVPEHRSAAHDELRQVDVDGEIVGAFQVNWVWMLPKGVQERPGLRVSQHPEAVDAVRIVAVDASGIGISVTRLANGEIVETSFDVDGIYKGLAPAQLLALARGTQRPQCYLCHSEVGLRPYGAVLADDRWNGQWSCCEEDAAECNTRSKALPAGEADRRLVVAFDRMLRFTESVTGEPIPLTGEMLLGEMHAAWEQGAREYQRTAQPFRSSKKPKAKPKASKNRRPRR